ncbi:hypothetical protein [Natrialba aegyptia]|uniref:Uncharacterized protein n=1 Tax=Natrialba aegyptia DSM 13077 TaxID=1227491 RepID=M0B0S9_9EURY|nr:hypothetical protein [Natrialba aegyptia]ELZ03833.1 hypothetical protein C480_15760 [Natrialba aegyptia DSM 13077]
MNSRVSSERVERMGWTERLTLALTAGYLVTLAAVFIIDEPILWVLWAAGAVGIVGVVLLAVNWSRAVPVASGSDDPVSTAETGTGTRTGPGTETETENGTETGTRAEKPAATEDGGETNANAERD